MAVVSMTDLDAEDRADRIRAYRPVIKLITLLAFGIPPVAYLFLQLNDDDLMVLLPVCGPLFMFTLVLLAILTFRVGPENLKALDRLFGFMFFILFLHAAVLMPLGHWEILDRDYVGSAHTLALVRMVAPPVLCLMTAIAFWARVRWVRWLVAAFVLWTSVVTHLWVVQPNRPGPPQNTVRTQTPQNPRNMMDKLGRADMMNQTADLRFAARERVEIYYLFSFSSPFWRPELRDSPHFVFCVLVVAYTFVIRRRLLVKAERAG